MLFCACKILFNSAALVIAKFVEGGGAISMEKVELLHSIYALQSAQLMIDLITIHV